MLIVIVFAQHIRAELFFIYIYVYTVFQNGEYFYKPMF